jgi:hypothetical protein
VTIYARESRKIPGLIVCGRCGQPVAYVHTFSDGTGGLRRMVYFEQGLVCMSGIWRRTPRNVARVRDGHRPQERNARPRPPDIPEGHYLPPELIPDHPAPNELPALVLCFPPRGCGALNTIDDGRLGLTGAGPLPTWPEADAAICGCCRDRALPAATQAVLNRVFRRFRGAT